MHRTSYENTQRFVSVYGNKVFQTKEKVRVLELGSRNVNGSFRRLFPDTVEYVGLDVESGPGVDVVLTDPYTFPDIGKFDIAISSSCFEHSEMFWLTFIEIVSLLEDDGLFYLNAPSQGIYHRYPVDCWRFYPDAGNALVKYANRIGLDVCLLESYVVNEPDEAWNDFVAVFLKDQSYVDKFPTRIIESYDKVMNARVHGNNLIYSYKEEM